MMRRGLRLRKVSRPYSKLLQGFKVGFGDLHDLVCCHAGIVKPEISVAQYEPHFPPIDALLMTVLYTDSENREKAASS